MVWRFLFGHEFLMQPKGENHELRRIFKESKLPEDHALNSAKAIPVTAKTEPGLRVGEGAGGSVQARAAGNEPPVRGEGVQGLAGLRDEEKCPVVTQACARRIVSTCANDFCLKGADQIV